MSLFTKAALTSQRSGRAYYFGGGQAGALAPYTEVYKFTLPGDTRSTLADGMTFYNTGRAGYCMANVAGYACGGKYETTASSTWERWAVVTDTRSNTLSMASGRWFAASFQDGGVAGYIAGGGIGGGGIKTVEKLTLAETKSTITELATGRESATGLFDNGVAGYVCGGFGANTSTRYDSIEKYAFPSDTRSTLAAVLAAGRWGGAGISDAGVAGYICGGNTGSDVASVVKFNFGTETIGSTSVTLSVARSSVAGASDPKVAGYCAGGSSTGNTVDKIAWPGETRTTLGTGLTGGPTGCAGWANA